MNKGVLMWIQLLKCMNGFYLNSSEHAPLTILKVAGRPLLNEWITDNILALVANRRKNELIWRETRFTTNFNIYFDSCIAVKKAISKWKAELM